MNCSGASHTSASSHRNGKEPELVAARTTRLFRIGLIFPILFLGAPQGTPQHPPTIGGTWTATVGQSRTLRGRWVGQSLPDEPNRAHGSWTLTNDAGKTVMSGTWSARKASKGWEGTWSARDRGGRSAGGTWRAAMPGESKASLQSMLERCLKEEIAGTWRSGGRKGSWWLKGRSPAPLP
jgi:hypothetical protein